MLTLLHNALSLLHSSFALLCLHRSVLSGVALSLFVFCTLALHVVPCLSVTRSTMVLEERRLVSLRAVLLHMVGRTIKPLDLTQTCILYLQFV